MGKETNYFEELEKDPLFVPEEVDETISKLVDQLQDCSRFQAWCAIKAIYHSMQILWWEGKDVQPKEKPLNWGFLRPS